MSYKPIWKQVCRSLSREESPCSRILVHQQLLQWKTLQNNNSPSNPLLRSFYCKNMQTDYERAADFTGWLSEDILNISHSKGLHTNEMVDNFSSRGSEVHGDLLAAAFLYHSPSTSKNLHVIVDPQTWARVTITHLLPDMPPFLGSMAAPLMWWWGTHCSHRAAPPQLLTFPQAYMAKIILYLLAADSYYVLVQFFTPINISWWFETDMILEKSENKCVMVPSTFL